MAFIKTGGSFSEGFEQMKPSSQEGKVSAGHRGVFLGELAILLLFLPLALLVHAVKGPLPGELNLELVWQKLILPFPFLTGFIEFASTMNWPNPALIGVITIIVALLCLRRWAGALVAGIVSGLGDASSYLANQLVQRPRPSGDGLYILQKIDTYYSFPSGHVVHVIAFFGFILFLTFQTRRRELWLLRLPLIYLLAFIIPSRVLEGEHWPSDVLGGALLGAFWLVMGIHFYHWLHRETRLRHLWPFSSRDKTSQLDQLKS